MKPGPGGGGRRAQACATARPSDPVIVRHQRADVPIIAASSLQVAASTCPYPATSLGFWLTPANADSGMVR